MSYRLRSLTWAASCLLPSSRVPLREKIRVLLRILFGDADATCRRLHIAMSGGDLLLDAYHRPDWRVFRSVFTQPTYAADFAGAAVVDIGAHRGFFTAWALQRGCRALVAYEPERENFAFLEQNASAFRRDEQAACVYRQAVGGEAGTLRLYTYDESWSHSGRLRPDKRVVSSADVEQVTLEATVAAVTSLAPECRRLIVKIDAEGAEFDILRAAPRHVLARIDELFIEVHDFLPDAAEALVRRLEDAGLRSDPDYVLQAGPHSLHHFVRDARA